MISKLLDECPQRYEDIIKSLGEYYELKREYIEFKHGVMSDELDLAKTRYDLIL